MMVILPFCKQFIQTLGLFQERASLQGQLLVSTVHNSQGCCQVKPAGNRLLQVLGSGMGK
jgi:hypothetical protein